MCRAIVAVHAVHRSLLPVGLGVRCGPAIGTVNELAAVGRGVLDPGDFLEKFIGGDVLDSSLQSHVLMDAFGPAGDWRHGIRRLWQRRCISSEEARAAKRYYSPADAPPVLSGDRVYVADRGYKLSVIEADSGKMMATLDEIVAVSPGPRPGTVLLRAKEDQVMLFEKGAPGWRLDAQTGRSPVPPVTWGDGTRGLIVSNLGRVTFFEVGSDRPLGRYSLATGSFHLATPEVFAGRAFFGSLDGTVTALDLPTTGK